MSYRLRPLARVEAQRLTLLVLGAVVTACGPTKVGGSGPATSGAEGEEGGPADGADGLTHGFEPDPIECSVPTCTNLTNQYDPAGCCEGLQPSEETDDNACPSDVYPNNWTCDQQGNCLHGGCSSDDDCPGSMKCLDPEEEATAMSFCVKTCEDNADCNFMYNALLCTGVAHDSEETAYGYCRQHPAPE